jgi:hypothetical protein
MRVLSEWEFPKGDLLGLILCTQQDEALARYALDGTTQCSFVNKFFVRAEVTKYRRGVECATRLIAVPEVSDDEANPRFMPFLLSLSGFCR